MQVGEVNFDNDLIAFSAFTSWKVDKKAFNKTTIAIIIASVYSFKTSDKTKLDSLSTTLGNYVTVGSDQQVTGVKTFTKQ